MKRPIVLGTIVGLGVTAMAVFGQAPQPNAPAPNAPRFPPIESIEKVADNLYFIFGAGGNTGVYIAEKACRPRRHQEPATTGRASSIR